MKKIGAKVILCWLGLKRRGRTNKLGEKDAGTLSRGEDAEKAHRRKPSERTTTNRARKKVNKRQGKGWFMKFRGRLTCCIATIHHAWMTQELTSETSKTVEV